MDTIDIPIDAIEPVVLATIRLAGCYPAHIEAAVLVELAGRALARTLAGLDRTSLPTPDTEEED